MLRRQRDLLTSIPGIGDTKLYMPAIVALRFNPILSAFADRLSAAGKHQRLIIGAVMRKLLVLAYGIIRSGKRFDANYA